MTFMPRMIAQTRAIRTLRPLSWRRWPGVIADVWHVQGNTGGGGFYCAPDPRLVVFHSGTPPLRLRTHDGTAWQAAPGAFYIPANVPLWSELPEAGRFSHLDLHLDAVPLARRMQAMAPHAAMDTARFVGSSDRIMALSAMIAQQVEHPTRPDMMTDGLLTALLAEVLDLPPPVTEADRGGLAPYVLRRLDDHARARLHRRITVTELAGIAGLSESWLTRAFRQSLGQTPQRWLMALRLEAAQAMMAEPSRTLADIAAATGFADQAHLTRAFRARHGQTPGSWRRQRIVPESSSHAGSVQASTSIPS